MVAAAAAATAAPLARASAPTGSHRRTQQQRSGQCDDVVGAKSARSPVQRARRQPISLAERAWLYVGRRHRHYAWRSARKLAPLLLAQPVRPVRGLGAHTGACTVAPAMRHSAQRARSSSARRLRGPPASGRAGRPEYFPNTLEALSTRSLWRSHKHTLASWRRSHIHKIVRLSVRQPGSFAFPSPCVCACVCACVNAIESNELTPALERQAQNISSPTWCHSIQKTIIIIIIIINMKNCNQYYHLLLLILRQQIQQDTNKLII